MDIADIINVNNITMVLCIIYGILMLKLIFLPFKLFIIIGAIRGKIQTIVVSIFLVFIKPNLNCTGITIEKNVAIIKSIIS